MLTKHKKDVRRQVGFVLQLDGGLPFTK